MAALSRDPYPPIAFFETPAELRRWFDEHHRSATELYVGFHKKGSGRASVSWPESVREAICFGWIDGVRKSLGETSYCIRFTPRKPKSTWSLVNIRHAEELMAEGLMARAGLAAFEARSEARSGVYTYEQTEGTAEARVEREMKKNRRAWSFFASQPPWYRRTAARWVMSAKREETRARRLATLVEDSARGRAIKPLVRPAKKK